jgi:MtfA peptidase
MIILIVIIPVICIVLYCLSSNSVEVKVKKGLPEKWEALLKEHLIFYHTLKPDMKVRFEERVHEFLLRKSIVGYQTEVDDRHRIMVAASAVMMTLSFEKWNFNYLQGIVLVDGAINQNPGRHEGLVSGLVRTSGFSSSMVLSKSSLEQGFRDMKDKKNVGVHEFAHVLDHADGKIDGIPKSIMPPELIEDWSRLMFKKIEEINKSKSDINPYGATNEAEFFAVVTEYFFERPHIMKDRHPQLYDILTQTFQQERSSQFVEVSKSIVQKVKEKIGRNAPCPCGSQQKFKRCCLNKSKA